MLKKDKLRYNEYFDMQSIFDELYQQSRNNNNFYKLMEVIGSKQNIRLAYGHPKDNDWDKRNFSDKADALFYRPHMIDGVIDVAKYREMMKC